MKLLIGRKKEQQSLAQQVARSEASFVVIYGRRRIGKTWLVKEFCKQKEIKILNFVGTYNQNMARQLADFLIRLKRHNPAITQKKLTSWPEAFELLYQIIAQHPEDQPVVVFIDELPWLDTPRSNFLSTLASSWNADLAECGNLTLVICGSAASYMINKVEKNKGPLHNRPTKTMKMVPFELHEVRELFQERNWNISEKSIVDLYLVFGGVAKYLTDLDVTQSPGQVIQEQCFTAGEGVSFEYQILMESLFNNAKPHHQLLTLLSSRWNGFTQKELQSQTKLDKAVISRVLAELIESGFVRKTLFFGQKERDAIYSGADLFSYFYQKWMKPGTVQSWSNTVVSPGYKSWAGFAFEKLCHMHETQIKKALGISALESICNYWSCPAEDENDKGTQIDMLIVLPAVKYAWIVECKYYDEPFTIDKAYRENLLNKQNKFRKHYSNYSCFLAVISPFGVTANSHFNELNAKVLTLEDLFLVP